MGDGARLRPVADADWPEEIADLRAGFAGDLNVYRTMAHHPALLRAWAALREHVVNGNALGRERAEIVILRAGVRMGSEYEWAHHVIRGRGHGLSDARIKALRGAVEAIEGDDRLLVQAVDELVDHKRLSPGIRDALFARFGRAALFDLMVTVAFYSNLAFILNTFGTPLDANIRDALEADPLSAE